MNLRKPLRHSKHNYSQSGSYFVTICVKDNLCCLGHINDSKMMLNQYGMIAFSQMEWLNKQYPYVIIRHFIIMPNHVHALIDIASSNKKIKKLSLSQLVGAYKTRVTTQIRLAGMTEFFWQRSFYDHIIRNEIDYLNIAEYIKNNPATWHSDRFGKNTHSIHCMGRA